LFEDLRHVAYKKNVLHPTDFSRLAGYASHLARALARDYGARLTVLHVAVPPAARVYEVMPSESDRAAEWRAEMEELAAKLRQLVGAGSGDVPIEHRLEEAGSPAAGILRVAKEIKPDLIVMGTHGRTWLRQTLLGSVAEQVLRDAPCPVVIVKAALGDTLPPDSETLPEEAALGDIR
jgi:nucleotide-binding universal stress UspA family protein